MLKIPVYIRETAVCKFLTRSSAIAKRTARPWFKIIKKIMQHNGHFAIQGHSRSFKVIDFGKSKARSQLHIGYDWILFVISYGWHELIRRNRLLWKGVGHLRLNIRLKGYVYRQHLYTARYGNDSTTNFLLEIFSQKLYSNWFVFTKTTNSFLGHPLEELGVMCTLRLGYITVWRTQSIPLKLMHSGINVATARPMSSKKLITGCARQVSDRK